MNPQERLNAKIVYAAIAYGTFVCYLVIVITLIFANDSPIAYEIILLSFLIPSAFSIIFSTIIIRKSLENDSNFSKTLLKLAIAHLPIITGLIAVMILVTL